MMYEPLTLPPIRRPKKSKIKSSEINMDLEAIRARRLRLEALTLSMRSRSLEPGTPVGRSNVHQPRTAAFSASKMTRQQKEPNLSASKGIRLEPLNRASPDMGANVLDKHRSSDPLLGRRGSDGEASTPKPGSPSENIYNSSTLDYEDLGRPPEEAEPVEPEILQDSELQDILEQLRSSSESTQLVGARAARERVSETENDCVDRYIRAGILPLLLALFHKDHNPELQFESLWAITNIAAGRNEHTKAVIDAGGLPGILRLLSSRLEKVALQAVWAVSNIIGDNAAMRDYVVEAGVVPILSQLVHRYQSVEAQRIISWTLSNLLRFKPVGMKDEERIMCLKALQPYLQADDAAVRVDAARGIEFASDGSDAHIRQVLELNELSTFISFLDSADYRLVQVGAKIIGNIVSGDDELTEQVVKAGAIPPLVALLRDDEEGIRKEAAWAVSNILAGTAEQIKEAMNAGVLAELLYILDDPEETSQVGREASWCLSNICNGGADETIDELVTAGTITTMLDYHKKNRHDKDLTTLLLMACKEAIKRTTRIAALKESLNYGETEQLLSLLIDEGNENALGLWNEIKSKVFNKS
ncbi:importin subunit alpha-6 [Hyalella azteca]|uniref:Importin subunit alpha-6 n=1 Tax=Hyalella azteca TaxID=294128 RepID=A0A8B7NGQ8_HYAAZ|nr:importin subunit alpha-6 [Hyalella azteca]